MLEQVLVGLSMMAVCVVIHASGIVAALRWRYPNVVPKFRALLWHFIRLAGWMILLHLGEIVVWGLLFFWRGAMNDLASALYFSAVTYTTTGYGDVVLPAASRLLGAIEALTGILMCGWSTGFFFALVSGVFEKTHPKNQLTTENVRNP